MVKKRDNLLKGLSKKEVRFMAERFERRRISRNATQLRKYHTDKAAYAAVYRTIDLTKETK